MVDEVESLQADSIDPPKKNRARRLLLVELVRFIIVAVFTFAGHEIAKGIVTGDEPTRLLLGAVLGATSGYIVGGILGRTISTLIGLAERQIKNVPGADLIAGALGSVVGMTIGALVGWPLLFIPVHAVGAGTLAFLLVVLGGFGYYTGVAKREDLLQLFGLTFRTRASDLKVLDTSAILDGRLLECVRSGFIRGTLLTGQFVLDEVQAIADSADQIRRNRGKRGLEMLAALHREGLADLRVIEKMYPEFAEVDAKVVALARERGAAVVTNDVALGRIAELQGLQVLSLNSLADALRPAVLPGEHLNVAIQKEGRDKGQGVGYLEDGSMVVVDSASTLVGTDAHVLVTSVISSSGGRMIFGKVVPEEAAR
ncbi:MAG: PIN domain-containing protein [Actinomycetota bacterium]